MTVMSWHNSEGCVGRCDAKCHNAKSPHCDCMCGGAYHGSALNGTFDEIRQHHGNLLQEAMDRAKQHGVTIDTEPEFPW